MVMRDAPPHKIWTQIQSQSCAGLTSYNNLLSCEVLWYSSLKIPNTLPWASKPCYAKKLQVYSSSNTYPTFMQRRPRQKCSESCSNTNRHVPTDFLEANFLQKPLHYWGLYHKWRDFGWRFDWHNCSCYYNLNNATFRPLSYFLS